MVNLSITEIGSIVLNMVENVPATISGALPQLTSNEIYNAENVTGDSIGISVADKYQPAIISLTASSVVRQMELTGTDTNSIKLGDLNISKGGQSNTAIASQALREDGMDKLNNLGTEVSFYKALG